MKIWTCPVCDYKTTRKELKEKHVHKEFDRKYEELEKLSTETFKEKVNNNLKYIFTGFSHDSGSFISDYKNMINFYKSV